MVRQFWIYILVLPTLRFSFLICEMEMIAVPASEYSERREIWGVGLSRQGVLISDL